MHSVACDGSLVSQSLCLDINWSADMYNQNISKQALLTNYLCPASSFSILEKDKLTTELNIIDDKNWAVLLLGGILHFCEPQRTGHKLYEQMNYMNWFIFAYIFVTSDDFADEKNSNTVDEINNDIDDADAKKNATVGALQV